MDTIYLRNYGISLDEVNALLEKQNNLCRICEGSCSTGRNLCVDHNHTTGKVRGMLCLNCNRAIGNLRDNPKLFERARDYLLEHE